LETVKVMSVKASWLMFCTIISTFMPFSVSGRKRRAAMPGLSGTLRTDIFASPLLYVIPETTTFSISSSSLQTRVPSASLKEDLTMTGIPYFLANSTERVCRTLAPRLAISSISS